MPSATKSEGNGHWANATTIAACKRHPSHRESWFLNTLGVEGIQEEGEFLSFLSRVSLTYLFVQIMEDIDHYEIPIYNFPYDIEEDDEETIADNIDLRVCLSSYFIYYI